MDNQLLTLSKIFTERLFRIPDYQRGYAWSEKQLKDFWTDIEQLEQGKNHYTGVLTLEGVTGDDLAKWTEDHWIIDARTFQPYYVVDGQQRLTTSIILIQAILEYCREEQSLNYTQPSDIRRKFVFESKDGGISRSYIFGYERDNPSYEFLKTKIFGEWSSTDQSESTVYTQNLERAKQFFLEKIRPMDLHSVEGLYKKVTQHLLFNIYTISDDVDVCVAFETMNNRGKPLSCLELLKNRLIYIALKLPEPPSERSTLRDAINNCWKAVYHHLGRSTKKSLSDDIFLFTHYITYFGRELLPDSEKKAPLGSPRRFGRFLGVDYARDLLERRFLAKNIGLESDAANRITLKSLYSYVSSLQASVEMWYRLNEPLDSDLDSSCQIWLDKLNRLMDQGVTRISANSYFPLILYYFQNVPEPSKRANFLQSLERFLFLRGAFHGGIFFNEEFIELDPLRMISATPPGKAEKLTREIQDQAHLLVEDSTFIDTIIQQLKENGFYRWPLIRYFLFEYNLELQQESKTNRDKLFWPEFIEDTADHVSVEHIFPQSARHPYWASHFGHLSSRQKNALRHSLGNLVPLSKKKNSSLSNRPFSEKVQHPTSQSVGYQYGCYAENELCGFTDWTPTTILQRGLKMLEFMESRWQVSIGDLGKKKAMLGLSNVNIEAPT